MRSIEWWDGEHVEHEESPVDKDSKVEHFYKEFIRHKGRSWDSAYQEYKDCRKNNGQQSIRERSGECYYNSITVSISEIVFIERNRFRPTEPSKYYEKEPNRINVFYRIKRDSSEIFRSRIPAEIRRIRMCKFMNSESYDKCRKDLEDHYGIKMRHFYRGLRSRNYR